MPMVPPFIELIVRQIHFRFPALQDFKKRIERRSRQIIDETVTKDNLLNVLIELGIKPGDTVMIHSSVDKLKQINLSPLEFLQFLLEFIGGKGNILMPTHPRCQEKDGRLIYDVQNSPSSVGLLTELFRRMPDVKRSRHPISSVAAWGPDSDYFLDNNLNENRPLPHGIYSPYWRLAQRQGKVLCLGTSIEAITIMHVAEDVLDEDFPIANFFEEVYSAVIDAGQTILSTVRRRRDIFVRYLALSRLKQDYKRHKLVHSLFLDRIPIHLVDASRYVDWMIAQAKKGYTVYPWAKKKNI
jgi:aminoglycoside 3-N-acetyltransferase